MSWAGPFFEISLIVCPFYMTMSEKYSTTGNMVMYADFKDFPRRVTIVLFSGIHAGFRSIV